MGRRGAHLMFTVRLPFQLDERARLQVAADEHVTVTVSTHEGSMRSECGWYVLIIRDLPTRAEAEELLRRLGEGLLWASLDKGVGIHWSAEAQTLVIAEDPTVAAENLAKA